MRKACGARDSGVNVTGRHGVVQECNRTAGERTRESHADRTIRSGGMNLAGLHSAATWQLTPHRRAADTTTWAAHLERKKGAL
ncbi:hypothetical protein GCM10009743_70200 [Kribbella swartbergensis]